MMPPTSTMFRIQSDSTRTALPLDTVPVRPYHRNTPQLGPRFHPVCHPAFETTVRFLSLKTPSYTTRVNNR